MKKTLLLICGVFAAFVAGAQTVVFHEDFETADSVTSTGNPTWSSNTTYQAGGLRSYRNQIALNDSSKLTTISFSTLGNAFVLLDFDQICKIQFFDNARLEVSNDNGNTWQAVVASNYLGTGQFAAINNRFCAGSYSDWQPGNDAAVPNNTWWKHETFDISNLCGNSANVMIRFKLNDGNNNGPNGAYGWLLDNIEVTVAPSELNPPVITYVSPIFLNNLFSLGPFPITVNITDASGVDTATVYYTVNGGPQQAVGMANTSGNIWVGNIPAVNDSDTVCYYVTAFDASPAANTATEPTSGCRQFVAFAGIVFPFFDDFESNNGLWSVQTTSGPSNWQYGSPAFGTTTGAYSGVNAWDVDLTTAYSPNANTALLSPVFDFSQAVNAKMSFWHNYNAEGFWDGVRIEYTTDGNTWLVLGSVGDPNAVNWYTNASINSSSLPAWDGASNGWVKSEYRLSVLNNVSGPVQFKFVFTSDASVQYDGYSIDDFLIRLPSAQDAEMDAVIVPDVTGCAPVGSNNVSVAIFNDGSQNIVGPMNVTYVIDNGTPVTEQYTGTIVPSQTDVFNFATPFNITAGTHTITVYTSLTNDGFLMNDTLTYTFEAIGSVSVPYFNGFESATSLNDFCVTNTTYGQVNLSSLAANAGTQGALFDATFSGAWDYGSDTITSSPNYIWQPTRCDEHRSNLRLLVNTATYSSLVLEFDARMNYSWSDEYTNFRVKVNGNMITPHLQPAGATGPYTSYRYDLTPFLPAGVLTIDFEAKVNDNFSSSGSGVFLDQVRIYEPQPFDVMMMSIVQPASQQAANSQATVQVQLRNVGINALTSIPVTYQVGANTPVTQTWTGNLPANASTTFTFTTQFTAPTGQFTVCAWTSLANDGDLTNDSACKNSTGIPLLPVPFSDNFDGASTFFAAQNTYTPSWELGTPAAPYITNAHTAPNAWEVNLNGAYQPNSMEYLYSPFFDFSTASSVQMRFWQWYSTDFGSDGGFIQYSADGGVTWQVLGVQNDPLGVFWYGQANIWASNTPGWSGPGAAYFQSRYNLSFLSGNPLPVQFRFVFASDGFNSNTVDGWAIDDFELIIMVGQEEQTLSGVQLSSYPNPASQTATITYSVPQAGQVTLALRDVMGKEIISETTEVSTGTQFWNVDVSTLPDGVYFYELLYNGSRSVQRLVVNH